MHKLSFFCFILVFAFLHCSLYESDGNRKNNNILKSDENWCARNLHMSSSSLLMSSSSPSLLLFINSMIGSTIVSLGSNVTAEKRVNSAYRMN